MRTRWLVAILVLILASVTAGLLGRAASTVSAQFDNSDTVPNSDAILELPQKWVPTPAQPLPPAPPALVQPEMPAGFVGCWAGNPGTFDRVYPLGHGYQVGQPGDIEFCLCLPKTQTRTY